MHFHNEEKKFSLLYGETQRGENYNLDHIKIYYEIVFIKIHQWKDLVGETQITCIW